MFRSTPLRHLPIEMFRIPTVLLLVFVSLLTAPAALGQSAEEEVVRALEEAFNNHDADAMAALVDEDIAWFSIAGDSVLVEVRGREALRSGMEGYFASVPSVRSEVEEVVTTGAFVAFRERVFWEGADGERTRAALGVYEVRDGLIVRAWYYPAVP